VLDLGALDVRAQNSCGRVLAMWWARVSNRDTKTCLVIHKKMKRC
jgi:hypothetical protein